MKNQKFDLSNNEKLQISTVGFLNRYEWYYFITLNLMSTRSESRAREIINKFLKELSISIFGRKSKKALKVAVSLEKHKNGGLHVHLITENPITRINNIERINSLNFKQLVKFYWEHSDSATAMIDLSCKDKESWFKEIYEQEGVLFYVTKEIPQNRIDVMQWELTNPTGYIKK
ncbi:hypothetical protein [Pseudomonas sp. N040]|uniref:hypothetical protein n=1 Tax=Pseudomonas sp. N040 TaxID=2785325 RepID=UPI0018A28D9B|nr:hypothetical protein [Pseudomonas sp. N040]MBF7731122.1 hypothetical protein [Pseudomonas sp. N040]MBW7014765.1 hypothetical protein [Pseudomonas sp. N040]